MAGRKKNGGGDEQQEAGEGGSSSAEYADAEAVEEMATDLIRNYHPELATASIRYVYREKAGSKGGRPVRGTVRKVSGVMHFITNLDFIVEVALDQWNPLPEQHRRALVDHLLERMTGEEDPEDAGAPMKWKTREPDVHEFSTILRRHGAWNDDLQTFVGVAQHGVDINAMVDSVTDTVVARN